MRMMILLIHSFAPSLVFQSLPFGSFYSSHHLISTTITHLAIFSFSKVNTSKNHNRSALRLFFSFLLLPYARAFIHLPIASFPSNHKHIQAIELQKSPIKRSISRFLFSSQTRLARAESQEDTKRNMTINIQESPDEEVKGISSIKDIHEKIKHIKSIQSQYTDADLYERRWIPSLQGYQSETSSTSSKGTFSVLQFNTLAQGLSLPPGHNPPFKPLNESVVDTSKSIYGGFNEIPHPEISLDFQLRKWRLFEVLLSQPYNTKASNTSQQDLFDIISLQEVDHFHDFFQPILKLLGYQGIFVPKPNSPCANSGWYSDGCAFFWNEREFELLDQDLFTYQDPDGNNYNQVCIVATMKHRKSNEVVVFAVTHLKSGKGTKQEVTRTKQVQQLLEKLESIHTHDNDSIQQSSKDNIRIIVMGDFNSDIREEESCVQHIAFHKESNKNNQSWKSAYQITPPDDLFYTTWKIRGPKAQKRVIDYIFYNGGDNGSNISCTYVMDVPSEDYLEPTKLPGFKYPSDHLAIGAIFEIK